MEKVGKLVVVRAALDLAPVVSLRPKWLLDSPLADPEALRRPGSLHAYDGTSSRTYLLPRNTWSLWLYHSVVGLNHLKKRYSRNG
jgi:hypothetical protein